MVVPKRMRQRKGLGANSYVRVIHGGGRILLRRLDLKLDDGLVAALQGSGLDQEPSKQVRPFERDRRERLGLRANDGTSRCERARGATPAAREQSAGVSCWQAHGLNRRSICRLPPPVTLEIGRG